MLLSVKARPAAVLIIAATVIAGCAGGAVTTTSSGTPPPGSTSTAASTSTTLPADVHPGFGASWAAVWPADGAEATYRVVWGDSEQDLTARLEYGIEWQGGTWDRLVLGTPVLGEMGMAWYFDRSLPWVLRLAGEDAFWVNADGAQFERAVFADALVLDLNRLPADSIDLQGTLMVAFGEDEPPSLELDYALRASAVGRETVTVPAGDVAEAFHIRLALGDGDGGGGSDLWVHPQYLLVRWDEAGIFSRLEMVTPWG